MATMKHHRFAPNPRPLRRYWLVWTRYCGMPEMLTPASAATLLTTASVP